MPTKPTIDLSINQRFIEVSEILKKSIDSSFLKIVEISPQNYSDIKVNRRGATMGMIIRLAEVFPEVNIEYVLMGKQPMFKVTPNVTSNVTSNTPDASLNASLNASLKDKTLVNEPAVDYISGKNMKVLSITVNEEGQDNIEVVEAKAAASYIDNIQEPVFLKRMDRMRLPGAAFKGGTFRAFEVKGNSMEPTILQGSWVIGRYLENFNDVRDGRVYIVVTQEAILIKRLLNRIKQRQQLWAQSDNPEFEARPIFIEDVIEIWEFKAEMRFSAAPKTRDMMAQLQHLIADLSDLREDFNAFKRQ